MDTPPLTTLDPASPENWTFVVPVRDATVAKTRLVAPPEVDHATLVRAMAFDTVTAVTAAGAHVVLVTSDPLLATQNGPTRVLPDPVTRDGDRGAGLSAALLAGLALVAPDRPAAVLLGDVPCLRAADVIELLGRVVQTGAPGPQRPARPQRACAFVRDAAGTGTTLLAATRRDDLRPRFGPGSAAAHSQVATEIGADILRARRDVDTASDLAAALRLGVGERTSSALDAARPGGWPSPQESPALDTHADACADTEGAGSPLRPCPSP